MEWSTHGVRFGQHGSPLSRLKNYLASPSFGTGYNLGSHSPAAEAGDTANKWPWYKVSPDLGLKQAWIPTIGESNATSMGWGSMAGFDSGRPQGGDPNATPGTSGWYTFSPMGYMLGREAHQSSVSSNPESSISGATFAEGQYPGPSYSGGWRKELELPGMRFDRVAGAGTHDTGHYQQSGGLGGYNFPGSDPDAWGDQWEDLETGSGGDIEFSEMGVGQEHTYDFTDDYVSGYSGVAGGGPAWNLNNLINYDKDELAGVVAKEFIPESNRPNWGIGHAADIWKGVLTPFDQSDKGVQIREAEEDKKLAYGTIPTHWTEAHGANPDGTQTIPTASFQNMISAAQDYDPIEEGGYDTFENRVNQGLYTPGGYPYTQGTIMADWIADRKDDWIKYQGNIEDVQLMRDELAEDKQGLTEFGDTARQGLQEIDISEREKMYEGTGVLQGSTLADRLAKQDIYNTASGDLSDFQTGLTRSSNEIEFAENALELEADAFANKWSSLQSAFSNAASQWGHTSNLRRQDWLPELKSQIMSAYS